MTDFHDVVFPLSLAFGTHGGPERQTDIVTLANGAEHRNTSHALSRRRYNAGTGITTLDDIHKLITFFEARGGQKAAFRFFDPMDHQSALPSVNIAATDQDIGLGDGVQTSFQLIKTYGDSAGSYSRIITKPVLGKVSAAVNGSQTPVSVDRLTGLVSFASPPASGAVITAGFQFDVPVRFDVSHLDISLESFRSGIAAHIPLIEVIDHG